MTHRHDAAWFPSAHEHGGGGFGVIAELIASGGDNGAGYCYNDLSLPADNGKEICGRITAWPAAGTLVAYEDTSFTFSGAPDGLYSFLYQLYVDGIAVGDPATEWLGVGVTPLTATASAQASASAQLSGTAAELAAAATATASASGSLGGAAVLSGAAVAHASASGSLDVSLPLAGTAQATAAGSGSLTTQIVLDADAAAQASAGAALSGGAGLVLPAARSTRRNMQTSARHALAHGTRSNLSTGRR